MNSRWFSRIRDAGEFLLEIILPSRERVKRTKSRSPEDLELSPEAHELSGIEITTLMNYRSEAAQDTVRALKYDNSSHAARLCAALLADYLREEIASIRALSPRAVVLVPVPLHALRERERGFNQIARVLALLPDEFKDGSVSRIDAVSLKRVRETKQQTHLSKRERSANVRGAFKADDACNGIHAIIIDDVATTGATLSACADALRVAGARVSAIALARA
jgi:ComF family protein